MTQAGAKLSNECGECFVCCHALPVNEPEFRKDAGTLCRHHDGRACTIYQDRYQVCRNFLCGWRLVPELGPAWRPDRSGVLLQQVMASDVPEPYRTQGNAFNFVITGGEEAVTRPALANYVFTLVSRRVAVFLSAATPKTLINNYLEPLVARGDRQGTSAMLLHIYRLHLEKKKLMQAEAPKP
jgi:hypothetical protein